MYKDRKRESHSRIFKIWYCMNYRCSPKGHYYSKGVRVCSEWSFNSEKGFENFKEWSFEHGYNDNLEIDRIDNAGNYDPSNCRWITHKEQCLNRSTNVRYLYKGERKTLVEYSKEFGIPRRQLQARIDTLGWPIEKALETPYKRKRRKEVIAEQ